MNIKHFSNDVQALARANLSGDSHLLKTSSGKLKENTLFERTLGLGKQLIARISGESYELKPISYAEGKALIQDRFNAQLRFFSGKNNFDTLTNPEFKKSSDQFLDSLLDSDIIFSNPKKALASQITGFLTTINNEGPEKTAFQHLERLYSQKNSSARFTAAAREFDYLRSTNANATVSANQITDTYKLGAFAERAHKAGATKDQAYFIAKLALDPKAFPGSLDENKKYDIAVSTFFHAYERGIRDFEKVEKILPLKTEEALAVRKLQDIRADLRKTSRPDSSNNTANKNSARPENNTSINQKIKVDEKTWAQWFNRAVKDGADANYANAIARLTLDYIPNLPTDREERYEFAKTTLSFIYLDKLIKQEKSNSLGKLKEIYVLKYAEASAESELWKIRKDIHDVLVSKKPTT